MKNSGIVLLAVIMPMIVGCGGNKNMAAREDVASQFAEATPFKTLPEEAAGSLVTGVGTSEKRANFTLMREAAITSAQADLARKIQSKVESVWKRTMADWSEYKKEDFIKIAKWIGGKNVKYYLQNFRPEKTIDPEFEKIKPFKTEFLQEVAKEISPYFKTCEVR